jgi:hypothetical protein
MKILGWCAATFVVLMLVMLFIFAQTMGEKNHKLNIIQAQCMADDGVYYDGVCYMPSNK